MEFTNIFKELDMKDSGLKIINMDKDPNFGQMELIFSVLLNQVKNYKENSLGQIKTNILVISIKINYREMANIIGQMEEHTKVIGKTI